MSDDTNLMLWPFPKGEPYKLPTLHTHNIFGVSFLPESNSSTLVTGSSDCCVSLHRIAEAGGTLEHMGSTRTPVHHLVAHTATFRCHEKSVNDIDVSQYEPNLAWSASSDGTVRQFDFRMPKSQQDGVDSHNVLIYSPRQEDDISSIRLLSESGFSSVRVNPVRPEMLAVGGWSDNVFVFDRRKLGPASLASMSDSPPRDHGISNADPLLILNFPFQIHIPGSAGLHPTYVSFGNRGDKLVATYQAGPAVVWSTLNSDAATATSLRSHFDTDRSLGDVTFFGNDRNVDAARSERILNGLLHENVARHGKDYSRRILKQALAEDPYNYRVHEALVLSYLQNHSSLDYSLFALMHAECCLRYAPAYLFDPYSSLLMSLDNAGLDIAALYMFHHIHRKFDGKSREYHIAKSADEYTMLKDRLLSEVSQAMKSPSKTQVHEMIQKALDGKLDVEYWLNKFHHHEDISWSMNRFRAELEYIQACGVSYKERKPMPLFTLGYFPQNFLQSYSYHTNIKTGIKEAVFFGSDDSHVICASDSGLTLVYEAGSGEVAQIFRGDYQICNCVRPHPTKPVIATSGLDSTVKIWSTEWENPMRGIGQQLPPDEDSITNVSLIEDTYGMRVNEVMDMGAIEDLYEDLLGIHDLDIRSRLQDEWEAMIQARHMNDDIEEDMYDYLYQDSEEDIDDFI